MSSTSGAVLAYLAVFRLEEIGLDAYIAVVVGLGEHVKIHKLILFLATKSHFTSWVPAEWSKVYDRAHVEGVLLRPYLACIDSMSGADVSLCHF